MKLRIITLWSLVALASACASPSSSTSNGARPAPMGGASADDPAVLGSVDGVTIASNQLDDDIQGEIDALNNELIQRRWTLLWVGFEQEVADRLLEEEAKKRGTTVEALLNEVATESEPTDEELEAFYKANESMIPVPFEEAKETLRQQLSGQGRQEAIRTFVDELRSKASIEYRLPVPNLPRFEVKAGDAPTWGGANAGVTIVEFSDFQCPYCSQARDVLAEVKEIYGDKVRVVYRDFPLAQHPEARPAAEAAQCAHEQGKFWAYHDLLFDNSDALGKDALREYATEAKLDLEAFESCLASERPKKAVAAHEAAARALGVQGTPAIFINGVKLIGLLPLPLLKSLIDSELQAGTS